jgi:hypothetical protein
MTLMINGQIPGAFGQATVPFAAWLAEDSVVIVGQAYLKAASVISATIISTNDDTYAQAWNEPLIRDVIPGTGFTIMVKPAVGSFKGNVRVDWFWR